MEFKWLMCIIVIYDYGHIKAAKILSFATTQRINGMYTNHSINDLKLSIHGLFSLLKCQCNKPHSKLSVID